MSDEDAREAAYGHVVRQLRTWAATTATAANGDAAAITLTAAAAQSNSDVAVAGANTEEQQQQEAVAVVQQQAEEREQQVRSPLPPPYDAATLARLAELLPGELCPGACCDADTQAALGGQGQGQGQGTAAGQQGGRGSGTRWGAVLRDRRGRRSEGSIDDAGEQQEDDMQITEDEEEQEEEQQDEEEGTDEEGTDEEEDAGGIAVEPPAVRRQHCRGAVPAAAVVSAAETVGEGRATGRLAKRRLAQHSLQTAGAMQRPESPALGPKDGTAGVQGELQQEEEGAEGERGRGPAGGGGAAISSNSSERGAQTLTPSSTPEAAPAAGKCWRSGIALCVPAEVRQQYLAFIHVWRPCGGFCHQQDSITLRHRHLLRVACRAHRALRHTLGHTPVHTQLSEAWCCGC